MSTYSARIIIEGGIDLTVELTEGERAGILLTAYEARERGEEERARREEQERARRRREQADAYAFDPDMEARVRQQAEDLAEAMRRMGSVFAGWGRPSTPKAPPAAVARPQTPRNVTDALSVVVHFTAPFEGSLMIPPPAELRTLVRRAKRAAHPDTGGTSADFQLVTAAEEILRRAGRI